MKAAVIAFTRRGAELGEAVARHLDATLHVPPRLTPETGAAACGSLEAWTAEAWQSRDALIFIGACGIAVRAIAPHVQDKFTDPAVVVMDEGNILTQGSPREVFSQVELLKQHHLDVPQATELAYRLRACGCKLPDGILNEEECVGALYALLRKE